MDSTFGIWLWLSTLSGVASIFFTVVVPAFIHEIGWSAWIEDLSRNLGFTVLKLLNATLLVNFVVLCVLNIPYWLSKKPFGWHDLPAFDVLVHDQFGALLLLSSMGGAVVALATLAWLFKREYVW